VQVFGNSDLTTLEWVSKRMGETTVQTEAKADKSFKEAHEQGQSGKSWSPLAHHLMTPEEISRFFGRDDKLLRQLIIRPSRSPMILQRAF
jgi:type IV secretion system protein VirD4